MTEREPIFGVPESNTMAFRGLDYPEFKPLFTSYNFEGQQAEWFGLISSAIHSYGSLREWEPAGRFNLIVSILGTLSYRTQETPALPEDFIKQQTNYELAILFTGFAKDGEVSPDLPEERERLSAMYGEDNVMPSFFTDKEGVVQLGLFVRRQSEQ